MYLIQVFRRYHLLHVISDGKLVVNFELYLKETI